MSVTMKDVAALAGVGVGTVSRMINGVAVKDVTRHKVEAAIKALDYEPDAAARAFKTNRSRTIALILPTIWHPFFSEFAYHVEESLSGHGYKLYLCNADGDPEKEHDYIQMVKQSKVDGIIGITYSDIDKFISSNLPFVSIDRHFSEEVSYVTADNFGGGELAAEELQKRGCQKLIYIGGINPYPNETTLRGDGFEAYCRAKGIDFDILRLPEPIADLTTPMSDFLKKNADFDGVFCVNDAMGMDVMTVLKKFGKEVLRDYQLIGFDGTRIERNRNYLVSTIVQPKKEMAEAAVDLILKKVAGFETENRVILPTYFEPSGTTKDI
ncbi:LacI family DNA-binding transcriptional regulator [Pseudolactococcus yaeyamensis]